MPELPEVESIKRQLAESIRGERIARIEIRRDKSFRSRPELMIGREISDVVRVGKYLFFHTESAVGMIGHLKMTGRMIVSNYQDYIDPAREMGNILDYAEAPHTRVIISFASNKQLFFWDTRVFGYFEVVADSRAAERERRAKLGPDPWEMGEEEFEKLLGKYQRPVKNVILDQALLAGVGNIYANDALWLAKIEPRRAAKTLSRKESRTLLAAIRQVMERGLEVGGASDNSYVNAHNQKGKYQEEFLVYRRTGKACQRCGSRIERVVVGGRGSFVCPKCQI